MKTIDGETLSILGRSILRVFLGILHPLMNARGEVGDGDDTNSGDDSLEFDDDSSGGGDGDDADDTPSDDGDPGAGDKPDGDKPPSGDEPPADDGQQPTLEGLQAQMTEMQTANEALQAQLNQANDMVSFYQGLSQQGQQQTPGMQNQQPGQPQGQQPQINVGEAKIPEPGELPEGIVPPEQWDSQTDQARYIEHRINAQAANLMQQGYQQAILPMFQKISEVLGGIHEWIAKSQHEDYDDIMKSAVSDIFNIGPDGKVYGVKNPSLFQYFQSQANPYLAMYQHGLTLNAPEKIKKGVQQQTKKTIENLHKKPKGPRKPSAPGGQDDTPELDWDTPPEQAEKVLDKRGLI